MSNSISTPVFVCSYTQFDNLAHVPSGQLSSVGITACELRSSSHGSKTLAKTSTVSGPVNPAFMAKHGNILYVCSESILEHDRIYVYKVEGSKLELLQDISSEGLSCCYMHVNNGRLYVINYWDSVIAVYSIDSESGKLTLITKTTGNGIKLTRAMHLKDRHSECHTHSIESNGDYLYVCDLGDDVMKIFEFTESNELLERFRLKTGSEELAKNGFHGPRYTVFSKCRGYAYVVNEISNSVGVLRVQKDGNLELLQTISSLSEDQRNVKSTCGGINLHPSGKFVCVSNRGHDSISVFRITENGARLERIEVTKTGGRTPRHFHFSSDGSTMLVPNQDTNDVSIFEFNQQGKMKAEGQCKELNSPNYVLF